MGVSTKEFLHEIGIDDEDQNPFNTVAYGDVNVWKDCFFKILCVSVELNAFILGVLKSESHE